MVYSVLEILYNIYQCSFKGRASNMVRKKAVKVICDPAFNGKSKLSVNKCKILAVNSFQPTHHPFFYNNR